MSEWTAQEQGEDTVGDLLADAIGPQEVAQALQPVVEQYVDQQLGARDRESATAEAAEAIVQRFPPLGEEANAQTFVRFAAEAAQQLGAPQLADSGEFWQMLLEQPGVAETLGLTGGVGGQQSPGGEEWGDDEFGRAVRSLGRGSDVLPFR